MLIHNLEVVNEQIISCTGPNQVTLIGVSKKKPVEMIIEAFDAGLKDFGENYVEEFVSKQLEYHPAGLNYHFIGRLPTKKVRKVVGKAQLIHSVDSLKLASKIDFVASEEKVSQEILIQLNQGNEASKSGIGVIEIESLFKSILQLSNIKIKGLMSIPPLSEDGRSYFIELREIRDFLEIKFGIELPFLSMGMSGDFKEAIAEGA
ncbi:MAG: YggS family pyridoxal phosphate-dependent enzyme, partial [Candidatus Poseidoniia archaeon]|nr:YggS family pyridoxal phosphate-dependent enzyme [Candidatus Poseidoniia archaeon]